VSPVDQPVPASSQLRVFPLKHIQCTDAEATIRTFFVERAPRCFARTGLGTKVNVVASNAQLADRAGELA